MGGLKLNVLFSSFDIGLKGSILIILFSYFIIAFRHRVLKFIDLFLSRQACKLSFIRITGKFVSFPSSSLSLETEVETALFLLIFDAKFVSFSLSVLKFGVVRGGGGSNNEKDAGGGG